MPSDPEQRQRDRCLCGLLLEEPPREEDREGPGVTSFCCRSSSFILISRASARAARFAASLASACNRPEMVLGDRPGRPGLLCSELTELTVTQTHETEEGPGITVTV